MKRLTLAAALLLGAASTLSAAQTQDVPKLKCEPKPELPGARMMEEVSVRKRFQADLEVYKKCMTAYLEERKVVIKANENAANAAIDEYNATMKNLADLQKAQ